MRRPDHERIVREIKQQYKKELAEVEEFYKYRVAELGGIIRVYEKTVDSLDHQLEEARANETVDRKQAGV